MIRSRTTVKAFEEPEEISLPQRVLQAKRLLEYMAAHIPIMDRRADRELANHVQGFVGCLGFLEVVATPSPLTAPINIINIEVAVTDDPSLANWFMLSQYFTVSP